jgi:hypothetical protein
VDTANAIWVPDGDQETDGMALLVSGVSGRTLSVTKLRTRIV